MKNLIVLLAFVSAMTFGSVAHAGELVTDTVDVNGLSATAQAEIALKVAELRKAALEVKTSVIPEVEDMEKYVSVGEQIGKALAVTARELGVEVNKFATSTVGMIAIFLIVWHFFGVMMVHIIFGGVWFMVLIPTWIYFFKRLALNREETFNDNGKRSSIKYSMKASGETVGWFLCMAILIAGVGIITVFSF